MNTANSHLPIIPLWSEPTVFVLDDSTEYLREMRRRAEHPEDSITIDELNAILEQELAAEADLNRSSESTSTPLAFRQIQLDDSTEELRQLRYDSEHLDESEPVDDLNAILARPEYAIQDFEILEDTQPLIVLSNDSSDSNAIYTK